MQPAPVRAPVKRPSFLVGLLAFAVYVASPQKVQSDSIWSVPIALSLVHRGDLDLDEYRPTCEQVRYACTDINGHLWSDFPVGPSLVAAVPLALFEALVVVVAPLASFVPPLQRGLDRWRSYAHAVGAIDVHFFNVTENLIASLCTAIAVGFFHASARRRLLEAALGPRLAERSAALLAVVFALGTGAWSTASRVLWQHGPAMMFGSIALYLLLRGGGLLAALGLGAALGAGWVCRPTMALFAGFAVLALAVTRPRALPGALAGLGLVAGAFVALNLTTLHLLLPPYFEGGRLEPFAPGVPEALAGVMLSPSRGLLVFSPIFLAAPVGLWASIVRRSPFRAMDLAVAGWLGAHWLVLASFHHWWGGHTYGPRLWTEVALGWCWLLVPLATVPLRRTKRAVLAALAAASVVVHGHGALSHVPWRWNGEPVNVDEAPDRLWDWGDPQALRGWLP